jgi:phage tail sheath protein FI
LHVRELLNTIEIQIEDVIGQYIFDFNNAVTRLNIVNSITPILETIKDAGALIKYEVVMDETNNPKELIAEGFGIIDINVWVTDVLKKIVNRITLNKDYGISSGGFVF